MGQGSHRPTPRLDEIIDEDLEPCTTAISRGNSIVPTPRILNAKHELTEKQLEFNTLTNKLKD